MTVLPCESIPTELGDFPEDWRVNYAYGMVMGVDDFRQEQAYHVGRKRLNNRGLHGYGVVYGLDVYPQDGTDGLEIVVTPGVAVAPGGQDIHVDEKYCLRLNDWLADLPPERRPSSAGSMRACVTLRYDECLERLVPVPGLPCADEDENRAYSRIRDAFDLRLDFDEPAQEAEAASRRFGDIMMRVEIDPTPGAVSDEELIVELVRRIGELAGAASPSSPSSPEPGDDDPLVLPMDEARSALRRIYRVWASEVRPRFIEEEDDRILLACLDFRVEMTDDTPSVATGSLTVDASGRPVLLNTRAIQELILAGGRFWSRESVQFATLHADSPRRVRVWVHHPEPLSIPASGALTLEIDHAEDPGATVTGTGVPNVFEIDTSRDIPEDAFLTVVFPLDPIEEPATGRTLREALEEERIHYVSRREDFLLAHGVFQGVLPNRRFVTVRYDEPRTLELWFHTDEPLAFHSDLQEVLRFFREGRRVTDLDLELDPAGAPPGGPSPPDRSYIWKLRIPDSEPAFEDAERLELRFDASDVWHGGGGASRPQLRTHIRDTETSFLGWDGDQWIHVFHRLVVEEQVVRVRPTRVFVRLCPVAPRTLRMWIQEEAPLALEESEDPLTLRVDDREVAYRIEVVDRDANVFDLHTEGEPPLTRHGTRIEVEYHVHRILVADGGGTSLGKFLDMAPWRYINHRDDSIFAYHLHCCCEERYCHFVTVLTPRPEEALLWFHTPEALHLPEVRIERRGGEGELTGEVDFSLEPMRPDLPGFSHFWRVIYGDDAPLSSGELLSLEFGVESILYGNRDATLRDHMTRDRVMYVCFDGEKHIRADHAVQLPPKIPDRPGRITEDEVIDVVRREIERWVEENLRGRVTGVVDDSLTDVTDRLRSAAERVATSEATRVVDERVAAVEENATRAARAEAQTVVTRETENILSTAVTRAKTEASNLMEETLTPRVRTEFRRFLETDAGRSLLEEQLGGTIRSTVSRSLRTQILEREDFLVALSQRLREIG